MGGYKRGGEQSPGKTSAMRQCEVLCTYPAATDVAEVNYFRPSQIDWECEMKAAKLSEESISSSHLKALTFSPPQSFL
jgi:hypothetical protein